MWRVSLILCFLSSVAFAEGPSVSDEVSGANRGRDVTAAVTAQLAAELEVITRTLDTVTAKLVQADVVRSKRLRSAYRAVRAPLRSTATAEDRLASARRRAGARLLADRDRHERELLAAEAALLATARERTISATARVPTVGAPPALVRPARGKIARRYGTLGHERSKATLSRRGIDLEVETRAAVSAPANGTIRYAGPIRGLDDGVIIDHGDYFTVVAKLADLAVPIGAPVRAGDRLGRAARSRVYLELRVRIGPGGVPIDPEPLLESTPPSR